jgi:hypothetical protein
MLAHCKNIEWLCWSQYPVAYAHRQRSAALRAKNHAAGSLQPKVPCARSSPSPPPAPSPPAKALVGRGGQAAWRFSVGWVQRALPRNPPSRMAELPDTFLISARDPLPLRLCTFAPLRSFLPSGQISARDPLPKEPYARSSPWHVLVDQSELL